MTPEQIQSTRQLLESLPEDERPILARAAAEFIRLYDAIERLYRMAPGDVRPEADFLGVSSASLADTVEQIVRRYVQ